jgi:RimJ/RimL family protein N-acetyltransferase
VKRWRKNIISVLKTFKAKNPYDPLICLPVYNSEKVFMGYLRPVTWDCAATLPGSAAQMAAWRNGCPSFSPNSFTATEESTVNWLETEILAREDRILFLVLSADRTRVGHLGFSAPDEREKSLEVDAVLRGETGRFPGLMSGALNTLVRWGLSGLKLKKITLRVLSDNAHAIAFYERNCFFRTAEIPLYRVAGQDREKWVPVKQFDSQKPGKLYFRMQLDIEAWNRANREQSDAARQTERQGNL